MSAEQHAHDHAHGGGDHHDDAHHGPAHYVKIWAILLVLLVISVAGPFLEIWWLTLITAFGIAFVKAGMVAKYFMHVDVEKPYMKMLLVTCLVFMVLFFAGTSPDVMRHQGTNWQNVAAQKVVADGPIMGEGHHEAAAGHEASSGHAAPTAHEPAAPAEAAPAEGAAAPAEGVPAEGVPAEGAPAEGAAGSGEAAPAEGAAPAAGTPAPATPAPAEGAATPTK